MPDLLSQQFLIATVVALALLMLILVVALRRRQSRRSATLVGALRDSTRHQVVPRRGPNAGGFAGRIEPAPDPFLELTITYGRAPDNGVLGWLGTFLLPHTDRLVFAAAAASTTQSRDRLAVGAGSRSRTGSA